VGIPGWEEDCAGEADQGGGAVMADHRAKTIDRRAKIERSRRQPESAREREFLEAMWRKLQFLDTLHQLAFRSEQAALFRQIDQVVDEMRELMNEEEIKLELSK
jgi:hypothetical protein